MYSKMITIKSKSYEEQIKLLAEHIKETEAIVVGAASGMSAAAGYRHYYERDKDFVEYLGDFEKKYGYHNSFDGFYYRYRTSEERWAFIARNLCMILDARIGQPYYDLFEILKDKNYYILTTNQDTQFTHLFPEEKISAIQGDWRYFQCGSRCHDGLYDSVEILHKLNDAVDSDLRIPTDMIPRCPKCGAEMEPWVRSWTFLEGKKYREEHSKFNAFLQKNIHKKVLFLELGVGRMTPMFIQEPFWNLTYAYPDAFYITINPKDAILPEKLKNKGLAIREDIAKVLADTIKISGGKNLPVSGRFSIFSVQPAMP